MEYSTLSNFQNAFELISLFLKNFVWPIFKNWWWLPLPFLLGRPFLNWWLRWRQELNLKEREYILLEIKPPTETLKPIKAMEDVFASLFLVATDPDPGPWREKWLEGDSAFFPSMSFEIAHFDGETHFFVRAQASYRDIIEAAFYSQYPDIEITEAEDYTKKIPQDIPNKDWDFDCREWILEKESCYPIKTYEKFETGAESKEEKRVDPVAGLLEALATLKQGEQVWVQILAAMPEEKEGKKEKWVKQGEDIRDKLSKRGESKPVKPMVQEAAEVLIFGPEEKKEEIKDIIPPEMRMTPGEREVVKEIERKISKPGFEGVVRIIYLAERDVLFKPHLGLAISYLLSFNTLDLNSFKNSGIATTKVKTIPGLIFQQLFGFDLDGRWAFVRKRRAFRNYQRRVNALYPNEGGTSVFNIEEMASLFHFPSRIVAPAPFVPRTEAKRGEAPPGLPVE